MTDDKKKAHKEALDEFRRKHMGELESNLQVLIGIRDDPEATDRNKIEAIKAIARMLSALQPDRQVAKTEVKKKEEIPFIPDEGGNIDIMPKEDTNRSPAIALFGLLALIILFLFVLFVHRRK